MSAAPDHTESDAPASPASWERALLDRQLERLDQLADMGMALAAEIQRRATTAAPDADITHAAIDFARVSRAVRMTLALQSRLVRDFKTPIKAGSGKADSDDDDEDVRWEVQWLPSEPTRDEQRANVRRVMRQVAEESGLDSPEVQRLDAEAIERLERDDIYADILARPFSELVADICRDLGLSPDWGRLAREWWAEEEIKSGKGGSPLKRPPPLAGEGDREAVAGAGQAHHPSASPASDSS